MSRVAVKDNEYHEEFNYNTVVIATSDPFTDEGQWNSIPINYYYKILGIGTRDPESRDTNNFLSNKIYETNIHLHIYIICHKENVTIRSAARSRGVKCETRHGKHII